MKHLGIMVTDVSVDISEFCFQHDYEDILEAMFACASVDDKNQMLKWFKEKQAQLEYAVSKNPINAEEKQ